MKLVNYLTLKLTLSFLIILTVWSAIYFSLQLHEIYDDIDEGLDNLRQEFIVKANRSADFTEDMMKHNPLNIIVTKISYEDAQDIKDSFTTTKVYFETESEEEEVRMLTTAFYSEPNGQYYKLQLFTSNVETEDLSQNMLFLLIILWVCLIVTMFILSKIILNKSNKPFFQLIDRLKSFRLEDRELIEFPSTKINEFQELNNSVKKLLENNIKTYSEQKDFIAHASHELQTPLAIAINKLEFLISQEGLNEDQMNELSSTLLTLNRMKRMNSNLLLLSKIQNRQFKDTKNLSLNSVIKDILTSLEDYIEHKDISYTIDEKDVLYIDMNEDLAYIMFTNLLKNAISYNIPKGKIDITISSSEVSIINDGKEPDMSKDIFARYVSGSTSNNSLGLGLPIVKAITDYYNYDIRYEYNGRHCMYISLPK